MKIIILLVVFAFACAFAGLVKPKSHFQKQRHYVPEEDNSNYKRFIYMENANGTLELVDLKKGLPKTVKVDTTNVRYYLYTQANPTTPSEILDGDVGTLEWTNFDSANKILFVIHGYNNDYTSAVNTLIVPAALNTHNINVFVVDWSDLAITIDYSSAQASVVDVGKLVGTFINDIQTEYSLSGSWFTLVGHSLGAHVAGNAGAVVPDQVAIIVGLDPAAPLFTVEETDNRLDPTDAQFVQIIHTDGILFGFASSIGDADYFPNGGMVQEGCDTTDQVCSHSRAYMYYAESIQRGQVFLARQCDSIVDYENGNCDLNAQSYMGLLEVDTSAYGDYYLDTNSESPFGQG